MTGFEMVLFDLLRTNVGVPEWERSPNAATTNTRKR